MGEDPLPEMDIQEIRNRISTIISTQELVDIYAEVHNKFWFIEDDLYDYDEGTAEYESMCSVIDAWGKTLGDLNDRLMEKADEDGCLLNMDDCGIVKRLDKFMDIMMEMDGG